MALAACGGAGGNGGDAGPGGADGGVYDGAGVDGGDERSYTISTIDGCGKAGYESSISAANGVVGIATLAVVETTGSCDTMNGPGEVIEYEICYAEAANGGAFATSVVTTQQYLALTGVGLAMADSGEATIAYTGGPEASLRCGASDMMVVRGTGGVFGTPQTIAAGSASGGLATGQEDACYQNVCNAGDATGYWPAVAIGPDGEASVAFRDFHFGFATDDFGSSDVEFAAGPVFSVFTVDVSRGGGNYLRLAFDLAGNAVVAHANIDGIAAGVNGIWINRRAGGNWVADHVSTAQVGEQLGFAISPSGLHGIAYYDRELIRLQYLESSDGETWSEPVDVDLDGIVGLYPSLAFGPDGEPAIAYYRCNDYHPTEQDCSQGKDGLFLARRSGGTWRREVLSAQSGVFDGVYPALAFDQGKAVVAFQRRWFDTSSGTNMLTLSVARED